MDYLQKAIDFATKWHKGQTRKYTGEDYINHPLEVARVLKTYTTYWTPDMLKAAILHDVLEDTDCTEGMLKREFGGEVTSLVYELTEQPTKGNRLERKTQEAHRLTYCIDQVQLIKCADIFSNCLDIVDNDRDFAEIYLREKLLTLSLFRYKVQQDNIYKKTEDLVIGEYGRLQLLKMRGQL